MNNRASDPQACARPASENVHLGNGRYFVIYREFCFVAQSA